MAFFFNRGRSRHPSETVRSLKEQLLRLREFPGTAKVSADITYQISSKKVLLKFGLWMGQAGDELSKQIAQVKLIVQGTQGQSSRQTDG